MKKIFYLGLIALFASCVKADPPEPTGEIKVRFVNTVESSTAQDMYIKGAKVPNSVALLYGQFSPYFSAISGDNAFAFADMGVTDAAIGNAGIAGKFNVGDNVSVFYFKKMPYQGSGLAAGVVLDDNATVADKAKVRFVHLNRFLENFINFKTADGTILSTGVAFTGSSAYYTVAPGTKFIANATELTEPFKIEYDLKAGKNYTIWLDGQSDSVLVSHLILQN
jgi:hypothetical protein